MHIVHAIEHKEWPVSVNFTAGDEIETVEKEQSDIITITTDHGIPRQIPGSHNSNITITNLGTGASSGASLGNNITISNIGNISNSANKKRKRHIAIDVETERGN